MQRDGRDGEMSEEAEAAANGSLFTGNTRDTATDPGCCRDYATRPLTPLTLSDAAGSGRETSTQKHSLVGVRVQCKVALNPASAPSIIGLHGLISAFRVPCACPTPLWG